MDNEIKDNNVKILKWTIMIMIFVPIILIVLFYLWFFYEAGKVNDDISVYDNQNNLIYDSEKENQIVEVINDTTILGIVELNHNGYIYIFNGQHFGEYGFEMEEYTRANIDNKNQICIAYITNQKYNTTYIDENDLIICKGDLAVKGNISYNSDLDTKDNAIIVLKAEDYNNMKKEVLNGKRNTEIIVGDYYNTSNEIYLKYSLVDKNYQLPFALKLTITDNTEIIGNIETGKKVIVEYENVDTYFDELKLKSIKVINENNNLEYYEENGNYYIDIIEEKIKIISPEKACDIADKEAQKNIYQYQDWKSDFYTRAEENNYQMAIELKNGININNLNWEDEWKKTTDYEDKLTWSVRLFDRNDPLTSLFIYIDATNGNILGAGKLSD